MALKDAKKLYSCPHCLKNHFKKKGYYYRRISKTYIPRYFCFDCRKHFSTRTLSKTYRQKRPDLNRQVYNYLTSGVTLRRTTQMLGCSYQTVYKKYLWLSQLAKNYHSTQEFQIKELQFDEMESIEHTKLKPLTIALAVSDDYKVLGVNVGTIPAKGHLSAISIRKYGPRENQSSLVVTELLKNLKVRPQGLDFIIKSDSKFEYKRIAQQVFPLKKHLIHIARVQKDKKREMKYLKSEKIIFDPIFALNQRMAKFRDHIKRLTRRSWCTTKKRENLENHIYLYMADNNGYSII
jgi:transposase-like protein